ncbi:hypothetical protein [Legionella longbeachae]|uniref:hypothetical protein n=1 Tax=Legionella longbeachae TaxID=450 RepID=UPI0001BEBCA4|nr:hypothetical protein [Legionella longbeachae]EEZ95966.1 hypothetical protein LLB_1148 [Legionella longbeachae D-4968]
MDNLAEVLVPDFNISFQCKKEAQKYLVKFILDYSNYNLDSLSELLGVNSLLLSQVVNGKDYLNHDIGFRLLNWFFVFIGIDYIGVC